MPAKRWLIGVFLVSLVVFLVVGMPARLLARYVAPSLQASGITLASVGGTVWHGAAQWRWRQMAGTLGWDVDWDMLTPGLTLTVDGPLSLQGWLGVSPSAIRLRDASLALPGSTLGQWQPQLQLDGRILARDLSVTFSDKRLTDVAGRLAYTGGQGRWARQDPVMVPVLQGELVGTDQGALLDIKTDAGELMASASVSGNIGALKVYRAWVSQIGLSRGGADSDVVFETSLPLWQQ